MEPRGEEGERGDWSPATFSASSSVLANNSRQNGISRVKEREKEDAPIDLSSLLIASLIIEIVFSKLLLLVDGLVLVVPNELCLL